MRLTGKLIAYLNRVWDRDPAPVLALRLRYAGGMTWGVADGVLTTRVVGGPGDDLTVGLAGFTLATLATWLAAQPGYTVAYLDSGVSGISARALLDGGGDIDASNGDHLNAYTSTTWAYLDTMAAELTWARAQIEQMLLQMATTTAEGAWLDEHGGYYAVPRLLGESDRSYGARIIAEVLRPRSNNVAIEAAIQVFTGQTVDVVDVTLYGDAVPAHDATIDHDGTYTHSSSAKPIYGLFDVTLGYDMLSGGDIAGFRTIITALIGRLRAAGTHLRSLVLSGSTLADAVPAPGDGGSAMPLVGGAVLADAAAAASEQMTLAGMLAPLGDAVPAPVDTGISLSISYGYTHNGVRRHDGGIRHAGGAVVAETV